MNKYFILAGLFFSVGLSAQNWQVRLRGISVQPNEKSTIDVIGGNANVSNSYIPEVDFTYFFNKNIAAELILGTTKHNVNAENTSLGNVNLGSVWLLPPTLTLQYHFYPTKKIKPYVGAGINYTFFYSSKPGDVTHVDYKNNAGFALQGGIDYMINDKFFVNFDMKKIFLKTDVTVDAAGTNIPAKVTLDPFLWGFGVGMKF
ncbi:outer membrane beta-barrel protein [Elizabethkingia sp. HX WHF]|uniref:OmpW/AlkL family protein n=1 Tax=Elizabethkingia TaxID=308865 RepID=UPI00099A34A0|nr:MULTISPECIES: OmpW family outer membrane protein [Elizabethkingia]ATL44852.1 OmpW family protein [Elizabethkingia miricola]MCL1636599.1 outer membrane beta-barrel protein [Elizabethkingia bruuniana]MDX8563925.1 outer membrane beta-barrel protein [Elizabethkingia sp. HX WHF]OPC18697.1 OmpW family protein [Elizabethkingia bruuniana]